MEDDFWNVDLYTEYIGQYSNDTNQEYTNMLYHYTSPNGLLGIIGEKKVRFTDCQYLNDKMEYVHIFKVLSNVFDRLRESLDNQEIEETINTYINKDYSYLKVLNTKINEKQNINIRTMRYYMFCSSMDKDTSNMWNYYVKNGNYQGYNIGIDRIKLIKSLQEYQKKNVDLYYGAIIYDDTIMERILENAIVVADKELTLELSKHKKIPLEIRAEIYGDIINELFKLIEISRLFFKSKAFKSEREFRIIIGMCDDICVNGISKDHVTKSGVITPFYTVGFNEEIIRELTIAPMVEFELAELGLRDFMKSKGYSDEITINKSDISIRY